jgi:diguanylate cyclase (GGDEF)-like protein
VIHLVLLTLNPFFDIFFSVDANNNYVRGSLFILHVIISYSYFLMAYIHALRHHDKLSKRDFYPLVAFPFIPAIGGIIQVLYYGTLLIWPSVTLGLLIIHLFMQTRLILIDALTELYNKREFNKKVFEITKRKPKNNQYGGIVIDIDDFKSVNDTYGHSVGDDALKTFGNILEKSFDDNTFVARIGGDEFAAIMKTEKLTSLKAVIGLIEENVEKLNETKQFPFSLSFSYGARMYDPHDEKDFKSFIEALDQYMYSHKKR